MPLRLRFIIQIYISDEVILLLLDENLTSSSISVYEIYQQNCIDQPDQLMLLRNQHSITCSQKCAVLKHAKMLIKKLHISSMLTTILF